MAGVKFARYALLMVTARSGTFRRAGQVFGSDPVTIAAEELTDDEYRAIVNERELSVAGSDDGENYSPVAPIDQDPEGDRLEDLDPGDVSSGNGAGTAEEAERLQSTIDDLETELAGVKERLADAETALGEKETALLEARGQLAEAETKAKNAEEAHARVTDQLTAAQARIEQLGGAAAGDKPEETKADAKPETKPGKAKGDAKS